MFNRIFPTLCMAVLLLQACNSKKTTQAENAVEAATPATEQQPQSDAPAQSWKTFTDEAAGFSFSYPDTLRTEATDQPNRSVIIGMGAVKISEIGEEETLGYDRATAIADQKALAQRQFGESLDFSLAESEKLINIGNNHPAKQFMVMSRFEVCDVTCEQTLIFYNRDHQASVSLTFPATVLKETCPQYFTKDPGNCGDMLIWKKDGAAQFYKDGTEGKLPATAQSWFNLYENIVKTVKLK